MFRGFQFLRAVLFFSVLFRKISDVRESYYFQVSLRCYFPKEKKYISQILCFIFNSLVKLNFEKPDDNSNSRFFYVSFKIETLCTQLYTSKLNWKTVRLSLQVIF